MSQLAHMASRKWWNYCKVFKFILRFLYKNLNPSTSNYQSIISTANDCIMVILYQNSYLCIYLNSSKKKKSLKGESQVTKQLLFKSVQLGYHCLFPKKYKTIFKEIDKVKTFCDFYIFIILIFNLVIKFSLILFYSLSLIRVNFC